MTSRDTSTVSSTTRIVLQSLRNIQREIEELQSLLGEERPATPSLRGVWRGVPNTDEDLEEAKHSWMKAVDDFDNE